MVSINLTGINHDLNVDTGVSLVWKKRMPLNNEKYDALKVVKRLQENKSIRKSFIQVGSQTQFWLRKGQMESYTLA